MDDAKTGVPVRKKADASRAAVFEKILTFILDADLFLLCPRLGHEVFSTIRARDGCTPGGISDGRPGFSPGVR